MVKPKRGTWGPTFRGRNPREGDRTGRTGGRETADRSTAAIRCGVERSGRSLRAGIEIRSELPFRVRNPSPMSCAPHRYNPRRGTKPDRTLSTILKEKRVKFFQNATS